MSTEIVSWQDKLAAFAQEAAAVQKVSAGTALTFKSGQMKIGGQAVAGNKLSVIVLGSIFENALYEGDYDSDNPRSPTCFAFGTSEDDMAPHASITKPKHDSCHGCHNNEWGSAEKGRGKACKNIQRLAIVPATPLTLDSINNGEVAYAKLPVTSNKNYGNYVLTLASIHKRPPFAVITEIGTQSDDKTQFKVTFRHAGNVEDPEIGAALYARSLASYNLLAVPYTANSEKDEEAPKKPASKKKF